METKPDKGVGRWLLAVGRWLLAVGRWPLAVGRWLLAVGCWPLKLKSKVHSLKSKVSPRRSAAFVPHSAFRIPHSPHSALRIPRSQAFTLMEMLVVLAVIGILTGLLFPALMGARERAKITRARGEVQQLQQAWLAYWNTYGQSLGWPSVSEMDGTAVAILGGDNPQGIAFMEFDQRYYNEGFKDPWGNLYRIMFAREDTIDTEWVFVTRAHCVNTLRNLY